MSSSITVHIPLQLYGRLEQMARRLQKSVDVMVVETLQAALPPLDEIPAHIQAEVDGLDDLDELALHEVAESEMAGVDQEALEYLLDLQSVRVLTEDENARLESLRMEYGRVLLRKARAFALLAERGEPYSVD